MVDHFVSQNAAGSVKPDTTQTDLNELMREATVDVVLAGRLLKLSRNTIYKAVRNGEIPSVRIGAQYRVPSAKLRDMLGLPAQAPSASTPLAA